MYRSVISLLLLVLLVGTVIAINPQARAQTTDLWEEFKPTLVAWMDKALNVLGLSSGEPDINIAPEPRSPGFDFNVIVTFWGDASL